MEMKQASSAVATQDVVTVSFRAECMHDVEVLSEKLAKDFPGGVKASRVEPGTITVDGNKLPIPDVSVEAVIAHPLDIATLHRVMQGIEDGHVMVETLRQLPLSENSLERRYNDGEPVDWTDNAEDPEYKPVAKAPRRP